MAHKAIPESAYQEKSWRINEIPYDKGWDYKPAYGWGWLGAVGVLLIFGSAIGNMFNVVKDSHLPFWIIIGFVLFPVSIILNSRCERKSLKRVQAQCLDVDFNYTYFLRKQSKIYGWAIRCLTEYELDGQTYQATPVIQGYHKDILYQKGFILFTDYHLAQEYYKALQKTKVLSLMVDPKRPLRSMYDDINAILVS